MTTRSDCLALDAADPLAPLRAQFSLDRADEQGVIYLDGNSLGALPAATAARVAAVVNDEWGVGLIRSWNTPRLGGPRSGQAGWIDLGQRIGDKIATLIGAGASEVVVADSTSVNLYKVLSAAMVISVAHTRSPAPARLRILSERTNFPTDLYIAETLARERGFEFVLADTGDLLAQLDDRVAILMLTHVN